MDSLPRSLVDSLLETEDPPEAEGASLFRPLGPQTSKVDQEIFRAWKGGVDTDKKRYIQRSSRAKESKETTVKDKVEKKAEINSSNTVEYRGAENNGGKMLVFDSQEDVLEKKSKPKSRINTINSQVLDKDPSECSKQTTNQQSAPQTSRVLERTSAINSIKNFRIISQIPQNLHSLAKSFGKSTVNPESCSDSPTGFKRTRPLIFPPNRKENNQTLPKPIKTKKQGLKSKGNFSLRTQSPLTQTIETLYNPDKEKFKRIPQISRVFLNLERVGEGSESIPPAKAAREHSLKPVSKENSLPVSNNAKPSDPQSSKRHPKSSLTSLDKEAPKELLKKKHPSKEFVPGLKELKNEKKIEKRTAPMRATGNMFTTGGLQDGDTLLQPCLKPNKQGQSNGNGNSSLSLLSEYFSKRMNTLKSVQSQELNSKPEIKSERSNPNFIGASSLPVPNKTTGESNLLSPIVPLQRKYQPFYSSNQEIQGVGSRSKKTLAS